ncbi:MAG: sugar phosphate isomerase/epimerase family protein [Candidatus Syntropharchaeia archaeon]
MIGVSTFAYITEELGSALEKIERVSNFAEILCEGRHSILNDAQIPKSFNLEYTVHAPITDVNLSGVHEVLRRASVKLLEEVIVAALDIEAKLLVVHPGYIGWLWEQEIKHAVSSFKKSLKNLKDLSEEYGIKIAIENQPNREYLLFRTPEMISFLEGVGFVLDVGHANTNGNIDKFLDFKIDHMHVHDNNGEFDEHLGIGKGNIDFRKLKDKKCLKILEIRNAEDVEESLKKLREIDM